MVTITQIHCYRLQFAGTLDENDLSRFCPAGVKLDRTGALTTLAQVHADQAALIGLLRHLHNMGCVIVQVQAEPVEAEPDEAARADGPARVVRPPCLDLPG